jgi:hypothetical protein
MSGLQTKLKDGAANKRSNLSSFQAVRVKFFIGGIQRREMPHLAIRRLANVPVLI